MSRSKTIGCDGALKGLRKLPKKLFFGSGVGVGLGSGWRSGRGEVTFLLTLNCCLLEGSSLVKTIGSGLTLKKFLIFENSLVARFGIVLFNNFLEGISIR